MGKTNRKGRSKVSKCNELLPKSIFVRVAEVEAGCVVGVTGCHVWGYPIRKIG